MRIYTTSDGCDQIVKAEDIEFPEWINSDAFTHVDLEFPGEEKTLCVYVSSVKDLVYGGCASGCYMDAVTYVTAKATMAEHGDEVMSYLWEHWGERPELPKSCVLWQEICCHWLSVAVEMWASSLYMEIEEAEEVEETQED